MMVFQNKCTNVIVSFTCYMTDVVSLMYSKLYPLEYAVIVLTKEREKVV